MSKKYELTSETITTTCGKTLYRVKALRDFGNVQAGELGGFIESEANLYHDGLCWVYGDAWVSGDAQVYGNAWVFGNAWVYGDARVYGDAQVSGDARVSQANHVITFSGFGSSARTTTAFKTKTSFHLSRGCFSGTLEEFRTAVDKTHGDNKFGLEYKLVADLIELHFSEE